MILHSRYGVNYSFINTELPHLEHFYINGDDQPELSATNSENVREFIRKNPTIRSLELGLTDWNLIICEQLPHLEILTLSNFCIDDDRVPEENVKKFQLTNTHIDFPSIDKLSMPRLDSLNIGYPDNSNEWMSFFNRHPQIRHLILKENINHHFIRHEKISVLTANLINLTHVTIEIFTAETDDIIEFIENHWNLNKFQFAISYLRIDQERALRERFENEWDIEEFEMGYRGLSLERNRKHRILD